MSEDAPLTVGEIRAEVKFALEYAHEQAEFWLEEREALQEMAVPLGVPWPQDEDESAAGDESLPAHAEGQLDGSDSGASDEDEKSEPSEEPEPEVPAGRSLDLRGLSEESRIRAVRLGNLTAKQREDLILKHLHEHHHPREEIAGPDLRDEIGMASSDFGNAMRSLRDRGLVEDCGYVRKPDGGKTQAKLWSLAEVDADLPRRRGPTPEANRIQRDVGLRGELAQVEMNGPGTPQGRVLAALQGAGDAFGHELEEKLDLPADVVGSAVGELMREGEVEQIAGGQYRAVPLPRNVSTLSRSAG